MNINDICDIRSQPTLFYFVYICCHFKTCRRFLSVINNSLDTKRITLFYCIRGEKGEYGEGMNMLFSLLLILTFQITFIRGDVNDPNSGRLKKLEHIGILISYLLSYFFSLEIFPILFEKVQNLILLQRQRTRNTEISKWRIIVYILLHSEHRNKAPSWS